MDLFLCSLSMRTYIGCSGYYYREWKGLFYPQDLPSSQWLQYYAQHFNTIEINSTFYGMPTLKSLSKWYRDTPDDFRFTVKANKQFTHFSKLHEVRESLDAFYKIVMEALQEKVHGILYQFPASVKYSAAMLDRVLALGSHPLVKTIEFRDQSWWRDDVYELLAAAGLVCCNISLPGFPNLFVPDKRVTYLRFHGKPVLYKSAYGKAGLQWWFRQVAAQPPEELLVYFNNTWHGAAIEDARLFRKAIGTLSKQ